MCLALEAVSYETPCIWHFPHYCTYKSGWSLLVGDHICQGAPWFCVDTVPIPVCGGDAGDCGYNPKYAEYVAKVTTWRTHLGLIVAFAGPHPGVLYD